MCSQLFVGPFEFKKIKLLHGDDKTRGKWYFHMPQKTSYPKNLLRNTEKEKGEEKRRKEKKDGKEEGE